MIRKNDKPCLWARIHSELSAGCEWIYFIFKTNNISRKPQVINHKWVNAGDVVPQVRGEKWRKNVRNDLAICLIPFQSNSFITTHYMTCFLINLQPSKLLLFFIFFCFHPEYNFIISKTTWLIFIVVSIIFRKGPLFPRLSYIRNV